LCNECGFNGDQELLWQLDVRRMVVMIVHLDMVQTSVDVVAIGRVTYWHRLVTAINIIPKDKRRF
jgi:hypothetical protein